MLLYQLVFFMSNRQGGPVLNLQSSAYIRMYTHSLNIYLLQFPIRYFSIYLIPFSQGISFPAYTCLAGSHVFILFLFYETVFKSLGHNKSSALLALLFYQFFCFALKVPVLES